MPINTSQRKGCSQTPRCLRRDAVAGGFCRTSAVTWIETTVTNSLHSLLPQHGQELPFRSSILGYLCYFSVGTLRIDIHRYPALVFHFSMLVRCRLVFKYSSNLRSCSAAGFALICGRSGCGGTQPRDMTSTGTCFSLRAVWAHIGLLNRDATAGVRIFRVQVHEQHRVKMCQM